MVDLKWYVFKFFNLFRNQTCIGKLFVAFHLFSIIFKLKRPIVHSKSLKQLVGMNRFYLDST